MEIELILFWTIFDSMAADFCELEPETKFFQLSLLAFLQSLQCALLAVWNCLMLMSVGFFVDDVGAFVPAFWICPAGKTTMEAYSLVLVLV